MPMPNFRLTPLAAAVALLLAGCDAAGLKLPGFGDRSPGAATEGHSGPPSVSPAEVPIETGEAGRPLGTANRATVGVAAYAAQGAGWSVVVDGTNAALTRQGQRAVRIPVRRIDFNGGVEFVGALGGQAFALTVRATECEGGAPLSASVRHSGRTSAGCAAPATAEQVATIAAAPTAPAPRRAAAPAATPAPAAAPPAAAPPAAATTTEAPATGTTDPTASTGVTVTPATEAPAAGSETAPAEAAATARPEATGTAPAAASTPSATASEPAAETPPPATEPAAPATGTTPPVVVPGGPTALPAAPALPETPADDE